MRLRGSPCSRFGEQDDPMTDSHAPIRYHDGVETPADDEDQVIDAIIASTTRESKTTAAHYEHAVRASYAKPSQGLLATPGTHR